MKVLKADLHVHSKFSKRPSEWILQKLGCAESYTDPVKLYEAAKQQGMDLVTITDHNVIDGALEIAHLPDTFISEEVTAYFPEDRCKLHVLCYDITEAQHRDLQAIRTNVYDLVDYCIHYNIPHAAAHAMYSLNGKLTVEHLERLFLLFRTFELNGSRNGRMNTVLRDILDTLDERAIEEMANRHNLTPRMNRCWEKCLIAGSDDHSSLNIARSHTIVSDVQNAHGTLTGDARIDNFLKGISDGRSTPLGVDARPETMAHNLYSIAYQFYKDKFGLSRHVNRDLLLRFADRALTSSGEPEGGLIARLHSKIGFKRPKNLFTRPPRTVQGMLQKEAEEIIWNDAGLRKLAFKEMNSGTESEKVWFQFVDRASETVLKNLADSLMDNALGANFFSMFNTIGSAGSLYTMLAPYFVAYSLFTKDRAFTNECQDYFKPQQKEKERLNVGHFSDTFYDVNGVARTLQMQLNIAAKHDKKLQVITCSPEGSKKDGVWEHPNVVNFAPIGTYTMPEYSELTLFYPPMLSMLRYAYEQDFTHIHSATPGPIGLVALAISKILQLPIHATYHTAFPQYVSMLTEDAALEEAVWKYMIWYYNQMDRVYVPSKSTGEELVERGIPKEKVVFYHRGIDTERFHPSYRNGFFKRYNAPQQELKMIYVGRISREKNLHILTEAFRMVADRAQGVRLVIVGDGPYKAEMEHALEGLPVTFTGYLEGDDLAAAYASSDVFVFPSGTDTFGNVVLEAQASGLSVIVTDKGGPKENLIPEKTGYIVPEGNSRALADAMLRLADNPQTLRRMREHARVYSEERSFESCFINQWEMYRSDQIYRSGSVA